MLVLKKWMLLFPVLLTLIVLATGLVLWQTSRIGNERKGYKSVLPYGAGLVIAREVSEKGDLLRYRIVGTVVDDLKRSIDVDVSGSKVRVDIGEKTEISYEYVSQSGIAPVIKKANREDLKKGDVVEIQSVNYDVLGSETPRDRYEAAAVFILLVK